MFASIWVKLGILLAILIIILLGLVWIYNQGAGSVATAIERQNNAAGNASDNSRSDYDACPVGMWDFGARKCSRR
jgi:hypothetical protein